MRLNPSEVFPQAGATLRAMAAPLREAGLEAALCELVYIRASQLNGCAFCLDMHTRRALAAGEDGGRLHLIAAWRDAPCFTGRERAALAWTEAVTLVAQTHVPDDVYDEASRHFEPAQLVALTLAVVMINGWNRLQVAFRIPAGNAHPSVGTRP